MKRKILITTIVAILLSGGNVSAAEKTEAVSKTVEILIVYDEAATEVEKQNVLEENDIAQSAISEQLEELNTICIEVSAEDGQAVMDKIADNPGVMCVQPNYQIHIENKDELKNKRNVSILDRAGNADKYGRHNRKKNKVIEVNEDYYQLQWGIENVGQTLYQEGIAGIDANVKKAWTITTGSDRVLVGVLDSGIDINNVDIKENIYVNKREIAGNGRDDDRNGYIDDVNGWDFLNDDETVYDSPTEDSHGTYVASILGAPLDDVGMVGVCPNVTIVPLKFMSSVDGGDTLDAIRAIEYAKKIGVKIINCSWNGSNYNSALKEAMKRSGILFVCASGNQGINIDSTPMYPASYDLENIISVGAIDNQGNIPIYSNYGKNDVDVLAPGDAILGQFPGNMYYATNGTSAAAPFVAGEAALISSRNPRMSSVGIKKCIMRNVTKDSRYTNVKTGGRIDVYRAVRNATHMR